MNMCLHGWIIVRDIIATSASGILRTTIRIAVMITVIIAIIIMVEICIINGNLDLDLVTGDDLIDPVLARPRMNIAAHIDAVAIKQNEINYICFFVFIYPNKDTNAV